MRLPLRPDVEGVAFADEARHFVLLALYHVLLLNNVHGDLVFLELCFTNVNIKLRYRLRLENIDLLLDQLDLLRQLLIHQLQIIDLVLSLHIQKNKLA